jgi:hypothetical protein
MIKVALDRMLQHNADLRTKEMKVNLMQRLEANSTWEPNSGCRIWLGSLTRDHGSIKVAGKLQPVHRLAWELERGPIPKGLWVLHSCGLAPCFNVNHLYLGTREDNAIDRKRHGGYVGRIGGGLAPGIGISSLPIGRQERTVDAPIDQSELRRFLRYDPETGVFHWRARTDRDHSWNMRHVGEIAGGINRVGYWVIVIRRPRLAHRLAWTWMTGEVAEGQIDHINGDRTDNRWSNLRLVTQKQNSANQGLRTNNISGIKGVSWEARSKKWRAQIMKDGKAHYLGAYHTVEEATAVRRAAELEHQGIYARTEGTA